jgi:hypothetical protein
VPQPQHSAVRRAVDCASQQIPPQPGRPRPQASAPRRSALTRRTAAPAGIMPGWDIGFLPGQTVG